MGIPGLFGRWLTKYIADSVVGGIPKLCSSLSFDMNGLFHEARGELFGEINSWGRKGSPNDIKRIKEELSKLPEQQLWNRLYEKITEKLLKLVQSFRPRDALILAVDGVAPGAKIQQQRSRREKSATVPNSGPFDRNCITPGTDFMIGLDAHIRSFLAEMQDELPPLLVYSSHLEPGEGEHKIMAFYRAGMVANLPVSKKGGSHILYGLDADLIMLASLSAQNKIVLSRQSVKYSLDIDYFKAGLARLGVTVRNFVIAVFFIGNDFLQQQPSLEAMESSINFLINTVVNNKLTLYGEESINWTDMLTFIKLIAQQENQQLYDIQQRLIAEKQLNTNKFLQRATRDGEFYPNEFRAAWYENEILPRPFTDVTTELIFRHYSKGITDADYLSKITRMCQSYAVTLEWVYRYYTQGTMAINHDWSYQFFHSPLLADLNAILGSGLSQIKPYSEEGELRGDIMWDFKARPNMNIFNALQQLVSVIPLNSKPILPKELWPLYDLDSPIRDLFPKTFLTESDGKKEAHEAIAIVPFVDRERIIAAVGTLVIPYDTLKRWRPTGDLIMKRPAGRDAAQRGDVGRGRGTGRGGAAQRGRGTSVRPRLEEDLGGGAVERVELATPVSQVRQELRSTANEVRRTPLAFDDVPEAESFSFDQEDDF